MKVGNQFLNCERSAKVSIYVITLYTNDLLIGNYFKLGGIPAQSKASLFPKKDFKFIKFKSVIITVFKKKFIVRPGILDLYNFR